MIVIGIIHAVTDIFDIGDIIYKMKNDNHSVHFASKDSNPKVEFIGIEAIIIQFISMVASLLIAYQGYTKLSYILAYFNYFGIHQIYFRTIKFTF